MFITGGADDNDRANKPAPEILRISFEMDILDTISKNVMKHHMARDDQIEGMVGTVRGDGLLFCGKPFTVITINNELNWTRHNCHTFNFGDYTWSQMKFSLNEHRRIYAQSVMLANGTFFVMGGFNASQPPKSSLETTEYLNVGASEFVIGPNMPDAFAAQCSKSINSTHIFTSGGLQDDVPIAKGNVFEQAAL